ncbi:MAG TPA: hypothetical protein VFN74_22325 [Chloroflexota bacterium]|nr:hypothetical protein [Chloroflexota bacterium]
MIPPFDAAGNLPPGVHSATWDEFVARFGTTPRRLTLLAGLKEALDVLRAAGCRRAYVDGSFVTAKPEPGDFDGCWETDGVDPARLDPVLLTFDRQRRAQKARFGGELFFADAAAEPAGTTFVEFFQRDRSGQPKGIVALNLAEPGVLP